MTRTSSKKNIKQKVFHLKQVGNKRFELIAFGKQLISSLGDDIFTIRDKSDLLFQILKQISPINKYLKPDDSSIEKACEKVIKHFGLHTEASIRFSTDTGIKEYKSKEKSNTEKFCEFIIGINEVPSYFYDSLIYEVDRDLLSISELIKWYEAQGYIQKYIRDNEIPKTHEDRIIFDFYKRCIDERVKILNFRLYNLKERAIEKSRFVSNWASQMLSYSEKFRDRPYYFAIPFSIHFFDCRKIDLSVHRIGELPLDEALLMQKLYSENKINFYRLYFKKYPIQLHFDNFKFFLSYLPLKYDRTSIFSELIRLFKAKRWISFYALALPQVEGLFSEMCLVISPKKDFSHKSLTHKVDSVRPFHYLSNSYFDYYQYHIPLHRNKFSHTGYTEDFKLNSFDLLVDLSHLLKIFYELDNPLVKIKKLHTRRNFEDFISVKDVVDYFLLLNKLEPNQKQNIKENIVRFEKDFLSKDCSIDYTCYEIMQNLPKQVNEFIVNINMNLKNHGIADKFEDLRLPEIEHLLKDGRLLETMTNSFIYIYSPYDNLENYSIFLSSYKKYLPSLPADIKHELDKLKIEYGATLKNVTQTSDLIKKLNKT